MNISELHDHIDLSQQYLANIHNALNTLYFRAFDQTETV